MEIRELRWVHEPNAQWDDDKARMIGEAPVGIFDVRFSRLKKGERLPGQWWHTLDGDRVAGYGWLDVVWGDAEIVLVSDPKSRRQGIGTFLVKQIEREASERGLRYIYNTVRPTHPERAETTAWFEKRGFKAEKDGSLVRRLDPPQRR